MQNEQKLSQIITKYSLLSRALLYNVFFWKSSLRVIFLIISLLMLVQTACLSLFCFLSDLAFGTLKYSNHIHHNKQFEFLKYLKNKWLSMGLWFCELQFGARMFVISFFHVDQKQKFFNTDCL